MSKIILDCDEAIQEICDYLAEADGEYITKIYIQISGKKATYIGDSMIEVKTIENEER